MQFIQTQDPTKVAQVIANTLLAHVHKNKHVLWLVPGGSNIDVAVMVGTLLKGTDLQNLHITLTDERFGPEGHANSNWQQLHEKGFMLHQNANLYPVLTGKDLETTANEWDTQLKKLFASCTYILGFLA